MPKLQLSFISAFNERVDPLMKGTVQAEGIEIVPTYSHPSETFWRQLKFQEYEVGEMSMSSYLIARERGFDIIALPVFPSRRLFHTELSYNTDSGIKQPSDLVGKRIGVGEYQQTAALWQRGILEHDFGVSQYKVHWYMERTEELSHGGATGIYSAGGNIVPAHSAGQKHGLHAGEQRIGRRGDQQPVAKHAHLHWKVASHTGIGWRLEQG